MNIKWVGASQNNYDTGRGGKKINKIVLHWIVGTLESADATFANPDRKASAHYGIGDGDIHQFVKEEDTAWHASNYTINQESIGIEHEGGWLLPDGTRKVPTEATLQSSAKLVADICSRYNIPIDREHIRLHNEYSATQCPGLLDANRIIELAKGLSVVVPTPDDSAKALQLLQEYKISGNHGNLEGAMRALLGDHANLQKALDSLQVVLKELDTLKQSDYAEDLKKEQEWQSKLESAKSDLAKCETQKAENLSWKELFSIAWRKWWIFKKGGDE